MLRPRTRESTGSRLRNKRVAGVLGTALVAGALGVGAGAQSASAAPVTYNVHCVPPSIGGGPFDFDAQVDLTVDPVKPKYNVGDEVTVTWTWKDAAKNPSSVTVNADAVKPRGKVLVSGAQGGEIAMEGPQKNAQTPGGEKLWLSTMTGKLKIAKPGELRLSPGGYTSTANMFGSWDTPCTPNGTPGVGTTLKVDGAIKAPTATFDRNIVRPGSAVDVTGENWPVDASGVTVDLCDPSGNACAPEGASGSTLTVDASGKLAGQVKVGADVPDAVRQVRIRSGGASVLVPISVAKDALRHSEPVTYGVRYTPAWANGPVFAWEPQVALSVTPAKPWYEIGDEVTVGWKWIGYPRNPSSWVVALNDTVTPSGTVKLSGAQTGDVSVSGPKGNPATPGGEVLKVGDMKGTFKITKAGRIDLAPAGYGLTVITISSSGVPTGTPAVSHSIAVGQPDQANLIVDQNLLKPGDTVKLSGANWPTGQGNPQVRLCAEDGSGCTGSAFVAGSGSVAQGGALTAQATLGAQVTPGKYLVKVTVGITSLTAPITVTSAVVLPREITATPDRGPSGTKAHVTGKNFTPGAPVVLETLDAGLGATGDTVEATATADGTFAVDLTVTKPGTTQIRASEKSDRNKMALAAFTFEGGGGPGEEPGTLSMTQAGNGVVLADVPFANHDQSMTGSLNAVTVTDARKGTLGWQLTGSVSDFKAEGGASLPASALSWTPRCVAEPNSASQVVTGSAGAVNGGLLCSSAASTDPAHKTGGVFTANAGLSLAIPAYQAAGTYTGTLTLTVS
ncbi:WxL domain-containing protein [Embleya sp. NPDC005575]|uniref:WxL domain-containing protein n=1 Tax=Embleya sp. NPDC005575 TaxID=3156892 RepID=UPI0033B158B9